MGEQVTITLLLAESPLAFQLAGPKAREAEVAQLVVSDASSGQPLWWIVSQPWAEAVSFKPMWLEIVPEADAEHDGPPQFDDELDPIEDLPPSDPRHQAAIRGPVDPIEDLPASDPRHQNALRRLAVDELGLRQPLSRVVYGVVPNGFREVVPGSERPPALVESASYVVFVDCLTSESRLEFSP